MKHGEGYLVHAGTTLNDVIREEYKGSWKEDNMDGFGIYKYISGAVYTGEWKDSLHHGRGTYEFPDGCVYEGEWQNHKMNGEGEFLDKENRKWKGEFVEGIYQSKAQKKLKYEKFIRKKKAEIEQSIKEFFKSFKEVKKYFDNLDF